MTTLNRNELLEHRIRRIVREELASRKETDVSAYQPVKGRCPMGCGETLFLGDGGYVTCSFLKCPEPDAVSTILEERETGHTATVSAAGITVRHPLKERLGTALADCTVLAQLLGLPGPLPDWGTYRIRKPDGALRPADLERTG